MNKHQIYRKKQGLVYGHLCVFDYKNKPVKHLSGLVSMLEGNAIFGYCFDGKKKQTAYLTDQEGNVIRIFKSNGFRYFPDITEVDENDDLFIQGVNAQ